MIIIILFLSDFSLPYCVIVHTVTKCHFVCSQVSLHRQEIADRLNAWTIFNDKNKEFCDWLTQMENKVCHSGDLSIEEMVEKLKKVQDQENNQKQGFSYV